MNLTKFLVGIIVVELAIFTVLLHLYLKQRHTPAPAAPVTNTTLNIEVTTSQYVLSVDSLEGRLPQGDAPEPPCSPVAPESPDNKNPLANAATFTF